MPTHGTLAAWSAPSSPPWPRWLARHFSSATRADSGVFVNGQPLEHLKRQKMERAYGTPILPGRYWYDPVSGAWGLEGGPTIGQIHPNMAIGDDLRADASKGRTGVFVNGRQLHRLDVDALNRCWPLAPAATGCTPTASADARADPRRST